MGTEVHEHALKRVISWSLSNILRPDTSGANIHGIDALKQLSLESSLAQHDEWSSIVTIYLMHILKIKIDKEKCRSIVAKFNKSGLGSIYSQGNSLKSTKALGIEVLPLKDES